MVLSSLFQPQCTGIEPYLLIPSYPLYWIKTNLSFSNEGKQTFSLIFYNMFQDNSRTAQFEHTVAITDTGVEVADETEIFCFQNIFFSVERPF